MSRQALVATLLVCAVVLLTASACNSGEGSAQRLANTADRGDVEAFDATKRDAEQGNANAQTELGAMYWGGMGTAKNAPEAVRWWERSAASGDCHAQGLLGNAYDRGEEGVPTDTKAAILWYSAAAEQGNTLAMSQLAELLVDPSGMRRTRNLVEAYKWLEILAVLEPSDLTETSRKAVAAALSPSARQPTKALANNWLQSHSAQLETSDCAPKRMTSRPNY
jgi:hypothetical protein